MRTIKAKDLKNFALAAPTNVTFSADDAAKSIAEGAYVGSFDADYYKSDRRDQKIDELTVLAPANPMPSHCRPQSKLEPSSVSRRISPATWSTSRAIA